MSKEIIQKRAKRVFSPEHIANMCQARKRYAATPEGKAQLEDHLRRARAIKPPSEPTVRFFSDRGRLLYPKNSKGTDWYRAEKQTQWNLQKGICDLCLKPLPTDLSKCAYDHNHRTEECRAVIHKRCNNLLTYLEEWGDLLPLGYAYLERHK
jgi:hypothetical protein